MMLFGDAASAPRSRRAQDQARRVSSSGSGRSSRTRRDEAIDDSALTDEQFFRMMREEIPAPASQGRFRAFAGEASRSGSRRNRAEKPTASFSALAFGQRRGGDGGQTDARAPEVAGAREQRRRERNAARADRMFAQQYADDDAQSASREGAPRAAVYEGRVGSSQRRAARMQKASEASPVSAKINPAGWFSGLNVTKRALRSATAVLCLVLTCAFLYSPAQQYYQALREHDRLAAEYAYIEQRNATLNSQNVALASDAGMEDAVRQKYGYVVEGDETAVVTGLSESATDPSRGMANVEANVLSSAVKAPEEWYTPYLDAFFGVS